MCGLIRGFLLVPKGRRRFDGEPTENSEVDIEVEAQDEGIGGHWQSLTSRTTCTEHVPDAFNKLSPPPPSGVSRTMDFLHSNLAAIQHKLAFVAVEPINWKFYVQSFSWSVTLWECYLL